ncbi:putative bifunctional diguanylate cyclase/phosphodiesterase [Saccharibacillus alkalitolerans]|uniref:EAL domain-containing protein n=1 Tax=Saccharibacillus alkalitolerans TaxID=2705290 RepID=A0ABX0EYX8_9BACL|nr:EAL domain-containing protein [Saccharibacillus alkalitolerans]NGZ73941.1 EAL domain-containing protein [Saccharibacillus alkalitolerans]
MTYKKTFYGISAGYLVLFFFLSRLYQGNETALKWIGHLNIVPMLICTLLLIGVWRRSAPENRLFWLFNASSGFFYLLSLLLLLADTLFDSVSLPSPSLADLFWLAEGGALFFALLVVVYQRLKSLRLMQYLLDASIFMSTTVVFSWSLIIEPMFKSSLQDSLWLPVLVNLSYPIIDLGNLFLLSLLLFANQSIGGRRTDTAFLASVLLLTIGDSVYLYMQLNGTYLLGSPIDATWTASVLLLAASGLESLRKETERRTNRVSGALAVRLRWIRRLLPYVSLVALFAIILEELSEFNVMVLGSALAVLLIIARLILTFIENDYLLNRLSHTAEVKEHEANHDSLTGLPNRRKFDAKLREAVEQAGEERKQLALLFFDLDRFKHINDSMGHTAGDRLLQIVAERLREYIPVSRLLARQGGDEFIVLVDPLEGEIEAYRTIAAIEEVFKKPALVGGTALYVTASIGVALYPRDGLTADELMRSADMAMHEAKKNRHQKSLFFEPSFGERLAYKVELEHEMRGAIERGEISLHYQLQKNIQTCTVVGVEALIRWNHPVLGLISPAEFIPVAEETGMIIPIGEWVFKTACLQQISWEQSGFGSLRMSVNVSPYQFQDELFVEKILHTLRETGVDPYQVTIEVTESLAIRDVEKVSMQLRLLRESGIRIAIDDFGTGYASLKYLRTFEPHLLKIDRFFVDGIDREEERGNMVRAIIAIGRSLNMEVLAEGVETEEQLQFLRTAGCDEVQGYYLSRPLPAEGVEKLLNDRTAMPGTA